MAMLRLGRNSSTKFLPWLRRFASEQGSAAGAEPPSISEWDDLIGELATEEEKREVSALKNHVLDLRRQLAPKSLVRFSSHLSQIAPVVVFTLQPSSLNHLSEWDFKMRESVTPRDSDCSLIFVGAGSG